LRGATALLAFLTLLPGAATPARQAPAQKAPTAAQKASTPRQKTFATPEAAVKALVAAIKANNRAAVYAVAGEEMRGTMTTGNRLLDDVNRYQLLKATVITRIAPDKEDPKRRIVYFGAQEWPFPAPLVKEGSAWRFDGAAGREEVEDRRIGWNELRTIKACRGYVEAQMDYASKDRTGEGYLEFAQQMISTPGKKDGLFWSTDDANDLSPLGPFLADASDVAARSEKPQPYNGYYFQILKAQGEHAKGGARDYVVDGHMTGGFALVAWPAEYDKTGIHTFLVNQLGVIYQKDLGTDTEAVAKAMTAFDPDDTWEKAK
jgi:hypothetical protein